MLMRSTISLPGSRPDGRPALTQVQRQLLLDRAVDAVESSKNLVAEAGRRCDVAGDLAVASRVLLAGADPSIAGAVRLHLEAVVDADRMLLAAPPVVLGSQLARPRSFLEDVLEDRFGAVAHVEGGTRLVAHVVIGQPQVVVLRDDLVRPSPVEAALLVRCLAPATGILVVSDHPLVLDDAQRVAVPTCSELAGADELVRALDRVIA